MRRKALEDGAAIGRIKDITGQISMRRFGKNSKIISVPQEPLAAITTSKSECSQMWLLAIDMMVWNTEEASGWWDPLQPLDGATMGWVGFDGASALVGISVWAPWWGVSRGFSETVLAFPILALASAQPKL